MWIQREISSEITKLAEQRPAIVVTGPRQTGKTSLLTKLFPSYHYISLDLPANAHEAEEAGESFLDRFDGPLIIDEIQYAPKLLRHIKHRIDQRREQSGQFIITGSQKFSLMKDVTESLAGRASIVELHSLSARELSTWSNSSTTTQQVLEWMFTGGYPEIHAKRLSPEKFYSDYIATYLERDVRQLINVRDLRDFDRFLRLAASRTGQLLSLNSLASDIGISPKTAKSWMSVLEASNIIHLLEPYYENFGKRLVKTPKLYFLDTGLACFLTGMKSPQQLKDSTLLGHFFESFALGQFIRHHSNRGIAPNIYFYRDHHGNEVDFLLPAGNRYTLLECKWAENPKRNIKGFTEIASLVGMERITAKHLLTPAAQPFLDPSSQIMMNNVLDLEEL